MESLSELILIADRNALVCNCNLIVYGCYYFDAVGWLVIRPVKSVATIHQ